MADISDDIIDGQMCSWCGIYFQKKHGYPVACKSCWKDFRKSYKNDDDLKLDTDVQKAIYMEL